MSRLARIAVGLGGTLAVVAVVAFVALKAVGPAAARRVSAELADRGLDATLEGVSLSVDGARVRRLCLEPTEGSAGELCLENLDLGLSGLASLKPVPTSVRFASGTLDLSAANGPLDAQIAAWRATVEHLTGSRAERDGSGEAPPRAARAEARGAIELDLHDFVVNAAGQGLPVSSVALDQLSGSVGGAHQAVTAHLTPVAAAEFMPAGAALATGYSLDVSHDSTSPLTVAVRGDAASTFTLPAPLGDLTASVVSVAFEAPYTFRFESIRVEQAGASEPLLEVPRAAIALRELTLNPADLYLGALEVDSPTLIVEVGEDGVPTILANAMPASADEEGSGGRVAVGSDAADAEGESNDPWAGRQWWQKLPQSIELTNARVVAFRSGARDQALEVSAESLNYAIRIINFQLDVTVRAAVRYAGADAGSLQVDGVWGWQNNNLRLNAHVEDLDLAALSGVLALSPDYSARGTLDLDTRFSEAARGPGLQFSGVVDLDEFALLRAASDDEPAANWEVGHVSYAWEASRTEGDGDPPVFRFTRGDLDVNGARAAIRPAFHRFNYQRTPFAHRVDLPFEVPSQPASALVDAVPAWLLGPLDGMQLSGDFGGWSSSDLALEAYQAEDGGWKWRPVWPDDWNWQNGTMQLVSLPEAVDVTRLNSSFDFTFRGLDGAGTRVIHVPPPSRSAPGGGDTLDDVADPGRPVGTPNWARLSEISWFVIATQLYREDGSFFRNGGINFLQMRNVIDEAFELGRFTRGASTISMQLVKNVFLTHERTVERKLQELILTYWMTRLVPKERILEVYLNVIEWGPGINGVSEAAHEYFGTTPDRLTVAQSVWLSAITPRPLRWSLDAQRGAVADWMQRNVRDLLNGLHGRGLITTAERDAGLAETITFGPAVPAAPAALPSDAGAGQPPVDAELAAAAPVDTSTPTDSGLLALSPEQRINFVVRTTSRPLELGTTNVDAP